MIFTILFGLFLILIFFKIFSKLIIGQCQSKKCLVGKTAVITGGNSGIGFETALDLASRGCKIIIADVANSETSVAKIKEVSGNENIFYKFVDLASLESVRKLADDIKNSEEYIDILINNAGTAGFGVNYTNDGLLKTMQINYFGHFLLTHLLIDLLKKRKNSRIVFVSSILAYLHHVRSAVDLTKVPKNVDTMSVPTYQYGNSKICMLMASDILSEKLSKYGIICNAVYPGVVRSNIFDESLKTFTQLKGVTICKYIIYFLLYGFGKNCREGAQTTLHCALEDNIKSGKYYVDCVPFWKPPAAKNQKLAQIIWEESEKLTKLTEEEKI